MPRGKNVGVSPKYIDQTLNSLARSPLAFAAMLQNTEFVAALLESPRAVEVFDKLPKHLQQQTLDNIVARRLLMNKVPLTNELLAYALSKELDIPPVFTLQELEPFRDAVCELPIVERLLMLSDAFVEWFVEDLSCLLAQRYLAENSVLARKLLQKLTNAVVDFDTVDLAQLAADPNGRLLIRTVPALRARYVQEIGLTPTDIDFLEDEQMLTSWLAYHTLGSPTAAASLEELFNNPSAWSLASVFLHSSLALKTILSSPTASEHLMNFIDTNEVPQTVINAVVRDALGFEVTPTQNVFEERYLMVGLSYAQGLLRRLAKQPTAVSQIVASPFFKDFLAGLEADTFLELADLTAALATDANLRNTILETTVGINPADFGSFDEFLAVPGMLQKLIALPNAASIFKIDYIAAKALAIALNIDSTNISSIDDLATVSIGELPFNELAMSILKYNASAVERLSKIVDFAASPFLDVFATSPPEVAVKTAAALAGLDPTTVSYVLDLAPHLETVLNNTTAAYILVNNPATLQSLIAYRSVVRRSSAYGLILSDPVKLGRWLAALTNTQPAPVYTWLLTNSGALNNTEVLYELLNSDIGLLALISVTANRDVTIYPTVESFFKSADYLSVIQIPDTRTYLRRSPLYNRMDLTAKIQLVAAAANKSGISTTVDLANAFDGIVLSAESRDILWNDPELRDIVLNDEALYAKYLASVISLDPTSVATLNDVITPTNAAALESNAWEYIKIVPTAIYKVVAALGGIQPTTITSYADVQPQLQTIFAVAGTLRIGRLLREARPFIDCSNVRRTTSAEWTCDNYTASGYSAVSKWSATLLGPQINFDPARYYYGHFEVQTDNLGGLLKGLVLLPTTPTYGLGSYDSLPASGYVLLALSKDALISDGVISDPLNAVTLQTFTEPISAAIEIVVDNNTLTAYLNGAIIGSVSLTQIPAGTYTVAAVLSEEQYYRCALKNAMLIG